jgi:hypothetical protein
MKQRTAIIVGAGLSGLAAAITLHKAGVSTTLVESADEVGGRVRTTKHPEGFLLDHGFQVLLSSYPELASFVDLEKLHLRRFHSGAKIFTGQKFELLANPLVHPGQIGSTLANSIVTRKDMALVLSLIAKASHVKTDARSGEIPTADFLRDFGFSAVFIENFWRPFLQGVFLDPELKNGHLFFLFLIRAFAGGRVTLPKDGMQMLPNLMSETLPAGSIRLQTRVESFDRQRVRLADGATLDADAIIWAAGTAEAGQPWKAVTTHYFSGTGLACDRWLMLVPKSFGLQVDYFCDVGAVSEGYSPAGNLLSVSQVGTYFDKSPGNLRLIEKELEFVAHRKLELRHLKTVNVSQALPEVLNSPAGFEEKGGVYYCGDRHASPSINGALRSGRLAAEAALQSLK